MSGGSLLEAIASGGSPRLLWQDRIELLLGIIRGIHYLHTAKEKPLIHRDIKSANVLLQTDEASQRIRPKIGDFGLVWLWFKKGVECSDFYSKTAVFFY